MIRGRLYRGLPTPLATVALTNSVTFGVYGMASRRWGNQGAWEGGRNGFCAGASQDYLLWSGLVLSLIISSGEMTCHLASPNP